MSDMIQLTAQMLEQGRSPRGGWTKQQLALLGVPWPLKAGWRERLIGQHFPAEQVAKFLDGRPALERPGDGLFADGGVVEVNPSPYGGTWAWCYVEGGKRIAEDSGSVTPKQVGLPAVTNNYTELLAAVEALASRQVGWSGVLYTDSAITQGRVSRRQVGMTPASMNGIPVPLRERLDAARNRLGAYRVLLLGGHPTAIELAAGLRSDGMACSEHNVYVDGLCREQAELLKDTLAVD